MGSQNLTPPQASQPAKRASVVTPSDSTDLAINAKALYIAVSGNIVFIPAGNEDTEALGPYAVYAGQVIPIQTRRVKATSTTATVVALYD